MKVEDTEGASLLPIVKQFVEKSSTIYTDEASIYNKLTKNAYEHKFVSHKQRKYVRAKTFTRTV